MRARCGNRRSGDVGRSASRPDRPAGARTDGALQRAAAGDSRISESRMQLTPAGGRGPGWWPWGLSLRPSPGEAPGAHRGPGVTRWRRAADGPDFPGRRPLAQCGVQDGELGHGAHTMSRRWRVLTQGWPNGPHSAEGVYCNFVHHGRCRVLLGMDQPGRSLTDDGYYDR